MAFSKIVGFDVRPRRSSLAINCFILPLVTSLRSIWSNQTLCPTFPSSTKGLLMRRLLAQGTEGTVLLIHGAKAYDKRRERWCPRSRLGWVAREVIGD